MTNAREFRASPPSSRTPHPPRTSRHRGKPRCHEKGGLRPGRRIRSIGASPDETRRKTPISPVSSSLRSMTNARELRASPPSSRTPHPPRTSLHRGKPRCYEEGGLRPGRRNRSIEPSPDETPPRRFEFARGIEPSLDDERPRVSCLASLVSHPVPSPHVSSSGEAPMPRRRGASPG